MYLLLSPCHTSTLVSQSAERVSSTVGMSSRVSFWRYMQGTDDSTEV